MLQQWADTLAARSAFPGLVADLIRASAKDIANIRFPSGDKGQSRGFDGVLEANGVAPYVPDGASIWEFGVSVGAGANVLKFSRPEIADGFMASGVIRNGNCGGELMGFQIST